MDLARYAELFLTESQEHLQTINEALLELERGGFEAGAVDRFFRAVHTIKGMSATMGYSGVAQLSHEMESLLSDVRDGTRSLDGDLLDPLFQATDALERAVVECAAGHADTIDLADSLAAISAARSPTGVPLTGDRRKSRRTGELAAISAAADSLRIEVKLRRDTPLPGVRCFIIVEKLRAKGEVISLQPETAEIQSEAFDGRFVVLLRSTASPDSVRDLVRSLGDVESVDAGRGSDSGPAPAAVERRARVTTPLSSAVVAPSAASRGAGATQTAQERRGVKHVRVEQRRLDALMNLVGELVIARERLNKRAEYLGDPALDDALLDASRQIAQLQDEIIASRMVPVWQVFDRFPRLVRDAARSLGKKVDFIMEGREIELDRSLLDEIGDPIVHLLRNAVDHGIESPEVRVATGKSETGRLVLSAIRDREAVLVTVVDDGKGMDREKIARKARAMNMIGADATTLTDDQLFTVISTSGFSTADTVTDISGRGVGIDAVANRVRQLGGNVELRTAPGEGTSVTIRLPLTVAIIRAMLARAADETYAFPLTHVAETVEVEGASFRTVRGRPVALLRGEVLPLIRLRSAVKLPPVAEERCQMVVLEVGGKRAGLIVDDLLGQQEVVVKQFDAVREGLPLFSGATILGNGELALIVDVGSVIQ